jgi:uncharacterized protein (TIGR01777 family)
MKVVVSGASGFIGSALVARLRGEGHDVARLVRPAARSGGADDGSGVIRWDPAAGSIDAGGLEGADAVVHLAGAGIADHRWSDDYKRELVESRSRPTTLLATTLAGLQRPPGVLLSASAVGWYGSRGDEVLDETSAAGTDFLAGVCREWEAATAPAEAAGVRVAHLRTGIVLSARGGALKKQLPLFKLALGGRMGDGSQWQSWISLDDELGAMLHLLTADVRGPVNLTAPNPVRNKEFAAALGTALHRPAVIPVPAFGPKLVLGAELAESLLFSSQRVLPKVLEASGYAFRHPTIAEGMAAAFAG